MASVPHEMDWVAIVDDDESIRRSLSRILLINGINVRTFTSAEDYLCRIDGDTPRCMVLDVQLGGLNGFELEDRLRSEGRAPPIIFMTARDDAPSSQLETRSGLCGCLRKPFDIKSLLDLVRPHVS